MPNIHAVFQTISARKAHEICVYPLLACINTMRLNTLACVFSLAYMKIMLIPPTD
jgi:hypothetical protein